MDNTAGVTSKQVPAQMKLQDYIKVPRAGNAGKVSGSRTSYRSSSRSPVSAASEDDGHYHHRQSLHHDFDHSASRGQGKKRYQSPTGEQDRYRNRPSSPAFCDYPKVEDWLESCKKDLERGRDGDDYTVLIDVLKKNGYHRVDSVLQDMDASTLKELAADMGVEITRGLAAHVVSYVRIDVERIKWNNGRF